VAPTFLGFVVINSATFAFEYHVARIVAGACEAGYMYSVMRWIVFRR
jgi:hypothetical protein